MQIGRLAARAAVASHDGRSAGRTSYVRQAVVWRIRDAYRRESREPQPSPSAEQFDADLTSLARRDFANEAIRRLDAVRAMRQLRPEYRRVLFELQVLDRSWHDAARERGLSLNALKALHQRALEQLRRLEAA